MVIGIDASQANTNERTGTEWYAFHLIEEWCRANPFSAHTVVLYTREALVADFPKLPPNWKHRILSWPPKIFWSQLRLSLEMLFRRVDLLFIPSHAIPFIHPSRTATTIHDIGFEHAAHVYAQQSVVRIQSPILQKFINFIVRLLTLGRYGSNELDYHRFSVRFALKRASTLFTVSEFSKKEIQQAFGPRQDIVVAYNGINHEEYFTPYPMERIHQTRSHFGIDRPYILSVGRIEKKKNSLALLKAFCAFKNLHPDNQSILVFAGSFGYGGDEVRAYAKKNCNPNDVRFLGWTPEQHLAPLLAGAEVFAFLSAYEGFGVPLLQSLAVNTPVLASNLHVFHEITSTGVEFCNPLDIDETVTKLTYILEQKQSGHKFSLSKQTKKFNWASTAAIISDCLLRDLAKR